MKSAGAVPFRSPTLAAWAAGILLLAMAGCAPGNLVVLMPDPDGNVGAVTVRNGGGARTIDRAGMGVVFSDENTAPSAPKRVPETKIRRWFGGVLAEEPSPPRVFVLLFRSGTPELTPESRALLPDILSAIRERDSRDISVVGHSDRKGSEELNWELSLERAEIVHRLLVDSGVPDEFVATTSHGEGNPRVPTPDDVAEPRNRRVEVTVR